MYFIEESSKMRLFIRLYWVLQQKRIKFNSLSESLNKFLSTEFRPLNNIDRIVL